ncbi:hypothetical protein ACO0QE_002773 [Hanseniaspora vineae]
MLSSRVLRLATSRSVMSASTKFSKDQVYKSSPTLWLGREGKRLTKNIGIWAGFMAVCICWPYSIKFLAGH